MLLLLLPGQHERAASENWQHHVDNKFKNKLLAPANFEAGGE